MASTEELSRRFAEMALRGEFQLILQVVREEYGRWREDLEGHLQANLLATELARAETYAHQGGIRALAELEEKLRTLARLRPSGAPPPESPPPTED